MSEQEPSPEPTGDSTPATERSAQRRGPSLVGALCSGALLTLGAPALAAFLFTLSDSLWARIPAVIVPLLLCGAFAAFLWSRFSDTDPLLGPPFLLALLMIAWPGGQAGSALYRLGAGHAGPISVAEVLAHREAGTFELTDAIALIPFRGKAMSTTLSGPDGDEEIEHHYGVLGLVHGAWQAEQEAVPAWLIDDGEVGRSAVPQRLEAYRARGRGEHQEAIEDARKRFGLRSADGAPLLYAQPRPREKARGEVRWAGGVWAVLFTLWLLGTAAYHVGSARD